MPTALMAILAMPGAGLHTACGVSGHRFWSIADWSGRRLLQSEADNVNRAPLCITTASSAALSRKFAPPHLSGRGGACSKRKSLMPCSTAAMLLRCEPVPEPQWLESAGAS